MPPPDPLAPVVQALSFLAAPKPPLNSPPQTPDTWTSGSNTATDGTLYTPAQVLLGLILGASSDLTSLGNGINSALTGLAAALASLAGDIGQLATVETDAKTVLNGLNLVLSMAKGFAPVAAASTLQSASALFGQLETLLTDLPDLGVAAAEMAEISQQLTAAAPLFPAA
jgi:hypothetical protein